MPQAEEMSATNGNTLCMKIPRVSRGVAKHRPGDRARRGVETKERSASRDPPGDDGAQAQR
jgi:hypothetical protein